MNVEGKSNQNGKEAFPASSPRRRNQSTGRRMMLAVCTLCALGVCMSLFAYYVETRKELDAKYVASCDISESISCSKVFTSRYGRGFGLLEHIIDRKSPLNLPNSVFGLAFYGLQIFLELLKFRHAVTLQLITAIIANLGSVYLGCILYFVLHDLCVVCVTTYVVNFLILLCHVVKMKSQASTFSATSQWRSSNKPKLQ